MDDGSLIVFLEPDGDWGQLILDLEASGAQCTTIDHGDQAEGLLKQAHYDGLLTSKALLKDNPQLGSLDVVLLLADDLKDSPEPDLIDPFATLGDRSVLRTLDRHLDRVEMLINDLEERL